MSNEDAYVIGVLRNHQVPSSILTAQSVILSLNAPIVTWSNGYLSGMTVAGSIAKGTAISGVSDVDILVALVPNTPDNLQQIYESLHTALSNAGYQPRRQNVSIGINLGRHKVDVVPAKKQTVWSNDHSIWSHKKSAWRQTNVHRHVQLVSQSGRTAEIKLVKIWRKLHNLDFPSFLLEMTVITALRGRSTSSPANNFATVLTYVRDNLPTARILDPANTNNVVSDELTSSEKQALSNAARQALNSNWSQVIW